MGKEIITQVQETQRVPNRINPRQNNPKHILVKLTNIKHKQQILKTFEVSSSLAYEDGKPIVKDGKLPKFCEQVEFINLSAEQAIKNGQEVLYITERCVFRLTAEGVELTEIAPGLDLDAHILSKLPFTPKISPNLKEMPKECFVF